jgi:hypothetical protein
MPTEHEYGLCIFLTDVTISGDEKRDKIKVF